jgi:hypothetical protein
VIIVHNDRPNRRYVRSIGDRSRVKQGFSTLQSTF